MTLAIFTMTILATLLPISATSDTDVQGIGRRAARKIAEPTNTASTRNLGLKYWTDILVRVPRDNCEVFRGLTALRTEELGNQLLVDIERQITAYVKSLTAIVPDGPAGPQRKHKCILTLGDRSVISRWQFQQPDLTTPDIMQKLISSAALGPEDENPQVLLATALKNDNVHSLMGAYVAAMDLWDPTCWDWPQKLAKFNAELRETAGHATPEARLAEHRKLGHELITNYLKLVHANRCEPVRSPLCDRIKYIEEMSEICSYNQIGELFEMLKDVIRLLPQ